MSENNKGYSLTDEEAKMVKEEMEKLIHKGVHTVTIPSMDNPLKSVSFKVEDLGKMDNDEIKTKWDLYDMTTKMMSTKAVNEQLKADCKTVDVFEQLEGCPTVTPRKRRKPTVRQRFIRGIISCCESVINRIDPDYLEEKYE